MRSLLGRFHRPMSRGLVNNMLTMNNLGDGSTLSLDFTTGVLDPRLTFTRSTTATYINSSGYVTSAAINAPRFDYSPTNIGEPRGLLVEGSAINIATNSTFSSGWLGGGNVTTAFNTLDVLDPAGTNTATKCTLANSTFCSKFEAIVGLAASTTYTWSYWIRGTAGNTQRIYSVTAAADLVAQTAYTYSTSGWTRVTTTFTTTAVVSTVYVYPINRNSGIGEVLYIWGAQLELGSDASSYIPTGASQVTRNADNCYIYDATTSGGLSWFKTATQGTFLVQATKRTAGTSFSGALYGTRATSTQDFMLYQAIGTNWLSFNWGASEYITNYSALSSPFLIKAAVSLSPGSPTTKADSTVSINGSNSAFNTTPNIALPFASDLFCIGSTGSASGSVPTQNYADTAIRSIKFYPFAMTAAQMNTLTTL